jgi:hypothetical protein
MPQVFTLGVSKGKRMSRFRATSLLLFVSLAPQSVLGEDPSVAQLQQWVAARNFAPIRTLGRPVLPKLVHLYEAARDDGFKARVAEALYQLGWESPEAPNSSYCQRAVFQLFRLKPSKMLPRLVLFVCKIQSNHLVRGNPGVIEFAPVSAWYFCASPFRSSGECCPGCRKFSH